MTPKQNSALVLASGVGSLGCQYAGFAVARDGQLRMADYLLIASIGFGVLVLGACFCMRALHNGAYGSLHRVGVIFFVLTIPGWLVLPHVGDIQQAEVTREKEARLRRILVALLECSDSQKERRLPPAALRNKDGQPLLSWRVLILPFLGHQELFSRFRLDEPWDSYHNRALLVFMPEVYAMPSGTGILHEPESTFWQVFVGPDTAFECQEGCRVTLDFPAGLGSTILVAEGAYPVPWTKPEDLAYASHKSVPSLGASICCRQKSLFFFRTTNSFFLGLGDASIQTVPFGDVGAAKGEQVRIGINRSQTRRGR